MSVHVTAQVGDDAAGGPGQSQSLCELESSFSNGGSWGEGDKGGGASREVG